MIPNNLVIKVPASQKERTGPMFGEERKSVCYVGTIFFISPTKTDES